VNDKETLASDMARLGARPYSEVGVPMFVIAQDMTNDHARPGTAKPTCNLDKQFGELSGTFVAMNPDPTVAEIARLVEVFADRRLLKPDGPCFTRLSER